MDKKQKLFPRILKKFSGQFTQLMVFLVLLFIFRPANRTMLFNITWQLLFAGVLFAAIFNCHHSRLVKTCALLTGVPAVLCNWASFVYTEEWVIVFGHVLAIIFLVICTWSILHLVIVGAKVTVETLRGAICVYFMIGYFFTLIYTILQLHNPHSFSITHPVTNLYAHSAYLSEMVYFSFTTLLSIGFGDIVPITNFAQSVAILEGVAGHFYLAILVARLVAVYSLREEKHLIRKAIEKKYAEE